LRYVCPPPVDLVRAAIVTCTAPGDLIVDPFAQGDVAVREGVSLGRRVIAVDFNPLTALATRLALDPPDPPHLRRLTTRLGDTLKAGVPLRQHLSELYRTTCDACGRAVIADYFVWVREEGRPAQKSYRCPACGPRTGPTSRADLERLAQIDPRGVHRTHLLERLAPRGDPHRPLVTRLLALYTPRNLYALVNLWLKIESTFSPSTGLDPLWLLLLRCLDACSKLNATPWDPEAPRSLRPPPQFVELNVVHALETAQAEVEGWTRPPDLRWGRDPADLLTPGPANALIVQDTVRALAGWLPADAVRLVLAAAPAQNHVFWTLSYLWTGWLFGRQKMATLRPLLDRRVVRASWYLRAMRAALASLTPALSAHAHLLLWQAGCKERLSDAVILAAAGAGLRLRNLVYQPEPVAGPACSPEVLLCFRPHRRETPTAPMPEERLISQVQGQARAALRDLARTRGETLNDGWAWAATRLRLSQMGLLDQIMASHPQEAEALDVVPAWVAAGLEDGLRKGDLVLFEERPRRWWSGTVPAQLDLLADRVERVARELLTSQLVTTEEAIFARLPGLLTPEPQLVRACLDAYGVEVGPRQWRLRPEEPDHPTWAEVMSRAVSALDTLGRRLGYQVSLPAENMVVWSEESLPAYTIIVQATAELRPMLSSPGSGLGCVVLPEARVPLATFKIERSPLLRRVLADARWDFVKLHHLLRLAELKEVDRHHWPLIVGLEPDIERPEVQMRLL